MMYQFFENLEKGLTKTINSQPEKTNARKKYSLEVAKLGKRLYTENEKIAWCGALAPFDILNAMGIITAINSDDAEMGRRLNQEAAKAVKYGGTSEEDAWKMVTLNPAKLLHIDDKMGSIKIGKDADIVLWTDNPLSIMLK